MSTAESINLTCPQCRATVSAVRSQIGQPVTCSDCLEEFIATLPTGPMPAPVAAPSDNDDPDRQTLQRLLHPDLSTEEPADGPLSLDATNDPAPKKRRSLEKDYEFSISCHICGTRLNVTDKQVGGQINCPDCHTALAVREPAPDKRRAATVAAPTEDDEFRLADAGDTDAAPSPSPFSRIADDLMRSAEAETTRDLPPLPAKKVNPQRDAIQRAQQEFEEVEADNRPLPPSPFRDGVAGFLIDPNCVVRLIILAGALWMELGAIQIALASADGNGLMQMASVLTRMFATVFGFVLLAVGAVSMQSILQDTANGRDEIESWPDLNFLDWIGDAFYIINSLFVCVAPAFALATVASHLGMSSATFWVIGILGSGVGLVFAFPYILLSMLEAGSPIVPVSLPVTRSVGLAAGRWILFLILSTVLIGVGLTLLVVYFAWAESTVMRLLLATLVVTATTFYFRLLGRLAWCCQEAVSDADTRLAEAAAAEEE